jgi:uncharacterized protein (TIGR02271 family)
MTQTITAIYESRRDAERAQQRLRDSGIPAEGIRILDQGDASSAGDSSARQPRNSFLASLKELLLPNHDQKVYAESIRRGGAMLCATVDDTRTDEVITVLEQTNPVDVEQRMQEWRSEGWNGDAEAAGEIEDSRLAMERQNAAADERIPIIEEQLQVGKRQVQRGSVRVRAYAVEQPVREQVRLRDEHVDIERRPVNQRVEPGSSPSDLMRERTIEVSESSEEPMIAKEAVVKEELVVRKRADERIEEIDDTVRHTEVDVDDTRVDPATTRRRGSQQRPGPRPEGTRH